ncbi:drug resistance transporter [Streptomyces albus]|uniref:Drug resistance transporter n=1 Tax=Streptomyces albus (strain ATCC 21838 / DSM 41398 / FERM P-419 / JCM 4703 / NBRC 107858) TaxID=1081613 RepID=A0A0B5EGK0_STRA4|nr:drug resistance transporter [Streptomyces albus]AOU75578.1 drug resistance transporter [Streptomyces albus]AYN31382.1 MFS transporter [Streptomyces albus]
MTGRHRETRNGRAPGPGRAPRLGPEVRRAATVVILGATLSFLDTTIVNVALKALASDFGTSLDTIQWIATAYLLAVAAAIPASGWAARRFGARRAYTTAVVLFTLASLLCALAQNEGQLIAFRALQGLGGGLIMPVGQIILARTAGPANLPRVMAVVGVPIVLAPVFGPFAGGLLLHYADWRWIFLVNLPVGALAVLCALRLLAPDRPQDAAPLDALGLAAISLSMAGLTYGLGEAGRDASAGTFAALGAGALLLLLFVVRTLRIPHPLFDIRLYRDPVFRAASLTTVFLAMGMYAGMVLMPLYFQSVRGEDPVATGVLLVPSSIGAAAATWLSGRVVERLGGGRTALIGAALSLAAAVPFVLIAADTPYAVVAAAMGVSGFGAGLSVMPAMTSAFRALDPRKISDASPQLNMVQRLGGSLATAVFVAVLQNGLDEADATAEQRMAAFTATFWWSLGAAALAALTAFLLARAQRRARHTRARALRRRATGRTPA